MRSTLTWSSGFSILCPLCSHLVSASCSHHFLFGTNLPNDRPPQHTADTFTKCSAGLQHEGSYVQPRKVFSWTCLRILSLYQTVYLPLTPKELCCRILSIATSYPRALIIIQSTKQLEECPETLTLCPRDYNGRPSKQDNEWQMKKRREGKSSGAK